MSKQLIAFTGRARSGKDTAADVVMRMYPAYLRYSFAYPIKEMMRAGLGIDLNDSFWIERKEIPVHPFGKSIRQMMQTLGTEWGRNLVHPNLWVLLAEQAFRSTPYGMVIPDLRFENEAGWVRKMGGRIVHVERPGERIADSSHVSEQGIVPTIQDSFVLNAGTLSEYEACIEELFNRVRQA